MPRVTDTRERIVCAAEDVVIRDGVARLTIESAAAEAGVSKGGVLYHFPTRASLVTAMVERVVVGFDADLESYGAYSGEPGDFIRAYVEATLDPTGDPAHDRERHLGSALLAGAASDPELLAPLRERWLAWQSSVEWDGVDPALATVIRYAADGMWLCDLFGLGPIRDDHRRAVGEAMRALIERARRP
ncbi:MAG: TetR/AcrR family transcriptional regulator [Acidimicrobiales bacterium]|jgi:AcrR family transcriptional regulator